MNEKSKESPEGFHSPDAGVRHASLDRLLAECPADLLKQLEALVDDPDALLAKRAREAFEKLSAKPVASGWDVLAPAAARFLILLAWTLATPIRLLGKGGMIVAAGLAVLLFVLWPFYDCCGDLGEAQITKCRQDLDTIRNAINLYESRYKPIVGTDLKQLLGQTMQDLPRDPWGSDYRLDADLGMIWSYGADDKPGGEGTDADIVFFYRPPLVLARVCYLGPRGLPHALENKMMLRFTKPYLAKLDTSRVTSALVVRDCPRAAGCSGGTTAAFEDVWPGVWQVAPLSCQPDEGLLALICVKDAISHPVEPATAIDLAAGQRVFSVRPATHSFIRKFGPPRSPEDRWPGMPAGADERFAVPAESAAPRLEAKGQCEGSSPEKGRSR